MRILIRRIVLEKEGGNEEIAVGSDPAMRPRNLIVLLEGTSRVLKGFKMCSPVKNAHMQGR